MFRFLNICNKTLKQVFGLPVLQLTCTFGLDCSLQVVFCSNPFGTFHFRISLPAFQQSPSKPLPKKSKDSDHIVLYLQKHMTSILIHISNKIQCFGIVTYSLTNWYTKT